MRKTRMLLVAVLMAFPIVAVTAGPAAACKQHPCPPVCKLNPPVYVQGDEIVVSDRDLIECYY